MNRQVLSIVLAMVLSLGLATVSGAAGAGPGSAAPPPTGVIYAFDRLVGGFGAVAVPANGNPMAPTCVGDASYTAPRLFLRAEVGKLIWSDSSCTSRDLYSGGLEVSMARWSPSMTKVAFTASWVDSGDGSQKLGIFVGDLTVDPEPVLYDVRRVHTLLYGSSAVGWTADSRGIAFAAPNPEHKLSQTDPDASAPWDVYVASLDGTVTNVTNTPVDEFYPSFAPSGDRLAFTRMTVARGVPRADIFTMVNGVTKQVTTKANTSASSNTQPTWSPDGTQIAFACMANSLELRAHVCRIDSSGLSKSVDLTPKTTAYFSVGSWRSDLNTR